MAQFRLSSRAKRDLELIRDYIAADRPTAAEHLLETIEEMLGLLAAQPGMGEACPQYGVGYRWFPVGNYIIFYKSSSIGVEVVRVLHGAQDLDKLF